MRKILLTAVVAHGAALALLVAACKAPDGAGSARQSATPAPAQNAATAASPARPPQAPAGVVRRVTPAELRGMLERGEAIAVDVRTKADYAGGHIKGALSLPLGEAAARAAELPKDKLVVFYCA